MKRTKLILLAAIVFAALRCGTTASGPAAPVLEPRGDDRYLIDPRIGFGRPAPPKVEARFEAGWRAFEAGDNAGARMRLDEVRKAFPEYLPAALGVAAIDIKDGHFERARATIERVQAKVSSYTAAEVYEAEIAARQNQLRRAYEL